MQRQNWYQEMQEAKEELQKEQESPEELSKNLQEMQEINNIQINN